MQIVIGKESLEDKTAITMSVNGLRLDEVKTSGIKLHEIVGILEMAKFDLLKYMKGKN